MTDIVLTPENINTLAKAIQKAQSGSSSSINRGTTSTNSGSGFSGLSSSGAKDAGGAVSKFVEKMVNANTSVAAFTKDLGNALPIVGGLVTTGADVVKFLEGMNTTFQNLSKVGAGFNGDLGALAAGAGAARMSIGSFATLIGNNSANLTTLGGSVNQGAKRFAELSRSMFEDGNVIQGMTNLGYSLEESNELLMDNAALLGRQARLRGMSDEDVTQATLAMAKNIAVMAEISGESAKKQKEDLIDAQRDGKNIAANRRMERRGITDATETMNTTLLNLGPLGKAAKAFAQDLNQTGTPMSALTKNFKLMHPQTAANIEEMQRVRESNMTTTQKNAELARLSDEAQANFAKESVGDTQLFAASIGQLNAIGASQAEVIAETRAFVEGVEAVQKRMGEGTTIQEATQAFLKESRNLINSQTSGGKESQKLSVELNKATIKLANGSSTVLNELGTQLSANTKLMDTVTDAINNFSKFFAEGGKFMTAISKGLTDEDRPAMNKNIQESPFSELYEQSPNRVTIDNDEARKRQGKAIGGGIDMGSVYKVGEQGPETFVAGMDGAIIPNMKAMLNRMPDIAKQLQDEIAMTGVPTSKAAKDAMIQMQNSTSVEEKLDILNQTMLQLVNINNMHKDISNKTNRSLRSAGNLMGGIGRA